MRKLISLAAQAASNMFRRREQSPPPPIITVTRDNPTHRRWRDEEQAYNRIEEFARQVGTHGGDLSALQRRLMPFGRAGAFLARMLSGGRRMSQAEAEVAAQVIDAIGSGSMPTPQALRDLDDAMSRASGGGLPSVHGQSQPIQGPPQTVAAGSPPQNVPAGQTDWSPLVRTPNSTNVFSIQYHYPSKTLYVRFLAPDLNPDAITHGRSKGGLPAIKGTPGMTVMGQSSAAGPLYAYYAVPKLVFQQLLSVAHQGGQVGPGVKSPGTGVWELLRIRGSRWAHHFKYRLIEGSEHVGPRGQKYYYVPRKITENGYRSRSMNIGRQWARSSLPATARPSRGVPNRGRRSL